MTNPFNDPRTSAAAAIRPKRSARFGLALLKSRDEQRQQLACDIAEFERRQRVHILPDGFCEGLSRYDPDHLSLFGVLHVWSHG